MEKTKIIPVKLYDALTKREGAEASKKIIKKQIRKAGAELIDKLSEEEFNKLFKIEICKQKQQIIIKVSLTK